MRKTVRIAAGVAAAVAVMAFAISCGGENNGLGPNTRTYTATLFASNEVSPASISAGTGVAFFVDNTTSIDWTLTLDGISEVTMSHIHGPALPGTNAPVIFNLFIPSAATGTLDDFTASGRIDNTTNPAISLDSLRTLFNNGRAYVNVHTTPVLTGAIRGQVVRTN
jgi:CHRD domain-containing protein